MEKLNSVLVIDDDDIFNFIATKIIERNGISDRVLTATNGEQGLSMLKDFANNGHLESVPDLILLDINMPVMNGWMFLEQFRKLKEVLGKDIKLAIVSTSVDPEDQEKAKKFPEIGMFISKPLKAEDLRLLTVA
ncbi:response regulator [Peijinzhouia sedimentorum]